MFPILAFIIWGHPTPYYNFKYGVIFGMYPILAFTSSANRCAAGKKDSEQHKYMKYAYQSPPVRVSITRQGFFFSRVTFATQYFDYIVIVPYATVLDRYGVFWKIQKNGKIQREICFDYMLSKRFIFIFFYE